VPVPRDQVYVVEGSEAQSAAAEYNTRINYLPPSVPRHQGFPVVTPHVSPNTSDVLYHGPRQRMG
jgi:hypothetical protein